MQTRNGGWPALNFACKSN